MVIAGAMLEIPAGDNFYLFGEAYCVRSTSYSASVDAGTCSVPSAQRTIGLALMGGGVPLVLIGKQKVSLSATVGSRVGVVGRVRW
jgi:hypothetical protein